MKGEHIEILGACTRKAIQEQWKRDWIKARRESDIPNTTTYIEPLVSDLGDFNEGVQQAQEESNFRMMKLLHYKEQ